MKQSGLAFHCHHDQLCEYVYDYDERVRCIKAYKPKGEQELRLRLFQMIPKNRIPQNGWAAYDEARAACNEAGAACGKAWAAYNEARAACNEAGVAYGRAWAACGKAGAACGKAWAAYNEANHIALKKLHAELCPDCPWDGKSIFRG